MTNQTFKSFLLAMALAYSASVGAQQKVDLEQIRWKSEAQVRSLLGDPISVHGPIGTHASYTLWKYENVTVAFANQRAFHVFAKDSLKKIVLEENR